MPEQTTVSEYLDYLTSEVPNAPEKAQSGWLRDILTGHVHAHWPSVSHEAAVLFVLNWAHERAQLTIPQKR